MAHAGPIPKELAALGELQVLELDRNQLSGKESAKVIFSSSEASCMDAYAVGGTRSTEISRLESRKAG